MTFVPNKAGTDAMATTTDPPYSKVNRTFANAAALLAATPQFVGEIVVVQPVGATAAFNDSTGASYQSYDLTVGHWQPLAIKE